MKNGKSIYEDDIPPLSNTTSSCGNGKLFAAGTPPDVVAQTVPVQLVVAAELQYTVFGVGNVIPELLPKSPPRVVAAGAAAPAITMLKKGVSDIDTAAHVIVRCVPTAEEYIFIFWYGATVDVVKVPLTVIFADSLMSPSGLVE